VASIFKSEHWHWYCLHCGPFSQPTHAFLVANPVLALDRMVTYRKGYSSLRLREVGKVEIYDVCCTYHKGRSSFPHAGPIDRFHDDVEAVRLLFLQTSDTPLSPSVWVLVYPFICFWLH
jgi:hypothetical protein